MFASFNLFSKLETDQTPSSRPKEKSMLQSQQFTRSDSKPVPYKEQLEAYINKRKQHLHFKYDENP
jgi:hypothetical protein